MVGCINIDIITPSVSPGGLYRVAIEEAKFLQMIGHNVKLISLIRPVNPWKELLQGIAVEYLADFRGPTPFICEMLNRNLFLIKKITSDAEIFICHNLPSCYAVMRGIRVPNGRIIAYIHDPIHFTLAGNIFQVLFRSTSLKKMFAMRWLRDVDVILVNSRRSQQVLAKELGLNSTVLYPTLASFSNKVPISYSRDKFFLSVGRIGVHPTYKILLHILKRVPEMELVIAGSWSHTAKSVVEMFSSDLEINRRVKFIVNPTDEELARLYRSARAFLYPGVENFNMSALEAISHGCPIVVSRESGICEILGESVVMPAQDDAESFVKLVLQLLNDERHAKTEGLRVREILKSYESSYHMENLREIVEEFPRQTSPK